MGLGLFGEYGGTEGGVTITEPQPQDTLLSSTPSKPLLAQRNRMEPLGFKEPTTLPGNLLLRPFCRQGQPRFTLLLGANTELSDNPSLVRATQQRWGVGVGVGFGLEQRD